MRTFKLVRKEDFSGVSGTGEVAEGIEFKNGKCAMNWDTKTSSTAIYENVQDLVKIHGHEGRTVVVYDDDGQIVSDLDDPRNRGLYPKYAVYKIDKDNSSIIHKVDDWVFVLNPTRDITARVALMTYASEMAHKGYTKLANDINAKLDELQISDW